MSSILLPNFIILEKTKIVPKMFLLILTSNLIVNKYSQYNNISVKFVSQFKEILIAFYLIDIYIITQQNFMKRIIEVILRN